MKKQIGSIIFYIVFIAAIVLVLTLIFDKSGKVDKIEWNDIVSYFENEQVDEFTLSNKNVLTLTLKPEGEEKAKTVSYKLDSKDRFVFEMSETINRQIAENKIKRAEYEPEKTYPWWVMYLPYILILVVVIILYVVAMKQMSKGGGPGGINNVGKARTKTPVPDGKNKVTFKDVAGADEEKAELEEVVEYLKDPQRYARLGAKIPHGVLLVGPPGTGKTLLAKAVAGEAGVPFFSISGSDFVELYVGVGASRVRDLFDTARKAGASIIFIDEIDAVGRHRGAGLGGGHDEREQTLNQLLVEMDGFGSHESVIIIAATNRPDILDPALLRPGRFDRQVTIGYPDILGREEILNVHARKKPFEPDVDFKKIAQMTVGFTGAELANLLNESALLAARKNKHLIGMEEIEQSFMKLILGPQKKRHVRNEHDNKLVAYHEAGHAVATYYCKHSDPVKMITIVPSGSAGGVTVSVPEEDSMCVTKTEMLEKIIIFLGGRVAEQLVMEDISTGASNDISQATSTAKRMVTRFGMSDTLGTVLYGSQHSSDEVFLGRDFSSSKDYSEKTAAEIDDEIRRIIDNAYKSCLDILTVHMDKLEFVAQYLLKHETMDGEQFKAAMDSDSPTDEEIEKIAEEKRDKSKKANSEAAESAKADEETTVATDNSGIDNNSNTDTSDQFKF